EMRLTLNNNTSISAPAATTTTTNSGGGVNGSTTTRTVTTSTSNTSNSTSSPSQFSSTLLQQLSRSNTFQTFIQSLNNNSSTSRSNDSFDEFFNSRILPHSTSNRQTSPNRGGSLSLHRRSSMRDHRVMKRKWRNTHTTTGEFPLSFDIVYCDGGYYSDSYNVENILRNDNNVYCSSKSTNINIILRFHDHNQDVMDAPFVLTKIIVKAPTQGYTAPCKEGLIFVSHEPISLEATSKYDDFTESDFQALLASGVNGRIEDHWPAAYFRLDSRTNFITQNINPNRSGKFILVKLLRSEGDEDNIDLQYLGLIGFTGPRSFDAGSLR
ncbi:10059_t:CDS:2, partial [Ambispora gerdemannii]